jgi:hypothetical protein
MLARQLLLLRPALLLVGAGLVVIAGCSSSPAADVAVTHPTMIEVSPESFLGDVPCARDGSGLKRYVATLFDTNRVVGEGGASAGDEPVPDGSETIEFQLPSSVATSCVAAVGFGFVVPGRRYEVQIDGYDTDDLRARALGARQQVSAGNQLVERKWSATCKRAIPVGSTIVRADQCEPFSTEGADPESSMSIPLAPLLGNLRCGSGEGEIDQLSVSLTVTGEDEPRVQTLACSDDARAVFDDLPPRQLLLASVTAFAAGASTPLAGASCTARTLPGATVTAQCSSLNQVATVRVELGAALSLLGLSCDRAQLSALRINVPGQEPVQVVTPPACLQPFEQGFTSGPAALTLTALQGDVELGSVTCHAEAVPGQLVVAQCEPNPAE